MGVHMIGNDARSIKELIEAYVDPTGQWRMPIPRRKRRDTPPYSKRHRNWRKILVLGDIHTGFHDMKAIERALRDNADADMGVVVGDFFEFYAYSRFTKTRYIPLRDELRYAAEILCLMCETIPKWTFVIGNHEDHLRRYIANSLPEHLLFLVETDLLKVLSLLYPIDICTRQIDGFTIQTVAQIGDAVFTHLPCSSKLLLRPVEMAYSWLMKWSERLNLDPSWRVVCQAHTHIAGKAIWGDRLLIQLPAMANIMEYMMKGRSAFNFGPPAKGYAVLYQKLHSGGQWLTDFNMSDIITL